MIISVFIVLIQWPTLHSMSKTLRKYIAVRLGRIVNMSQMDGGLLSTLELTSS